MTDCDNNNIVSVERDICTGIGKNTIHQLNKLDEKLGKRKRVRIYPITYIQAVYDAKTGTRLDGFLNMVNSIYLPWHGSAKSTRLQVPFHLRRKGLMISYRNIDNEIITEKCILEECVKDDLFKLDSSWVRITDALPVSGNVTIGSNGNWFVDGEDTGFKAQGPKGDNGVPLQPRLSEDGTTIEYSLDGEEWKELFPLSLITPNISFEEPVGLEPGATPTVENVGDGFNVNLQFGLPKAPEVNVGSTTTIGEGNQAKVTNSGTPYAPLLNFQIPKGDTGRGITIKGFYPDLSTLQEKITSPAIGDVYCVGSTEPYTGYVWTNVYSSESQTAIPAWQSIGTINKDTTILVNDLGDREDVAMSQLSISNLTNEYNVSVNLPSREYVYYSPKWKSIEYDESVSLYDDAITYHVGDKCNINGDISNTYQSVEEAIGEAPYSKEINNKYTLEEAFYNLPLVLKRNGIILSFVNHNNIVEKWENIKGINNVNFKNTHWKLVGSSKISSIDQSIYNLSIFISKVFPLDHFSVQDIKDMSDTGYLNSSGNIITSGQYYEKFKYQIIKTEPNTVYHISGLTGGEVALHIVLYGFNEEFIYGESYPKELFVSGDIINYIGLCTTKEEEAIVESYRIEIPYVDITYGNILINSEKIEKNKYIDVNNGVSKNIETELILGVTDYIYVHNRNIFIQGGSMGIGESIGHAVFDLNKKFIRGVKTNEIYLDKDEYYIRCTLRIGEEEYKVIDMDSYCDNSYPNNAIAYPFIEQPRFSGTFNNLLYCGTDGKNLLNPKKIIKGNYYISTDDGKIYFDEYDNFGVSDYIPIDEDGLNITGGYVAGNKIGHAIYDFEKKFIRGVRSNIVQYQEGDCFVRFTLKKGVDTIQVEKGLTPSNFQPFGKDRYYVNPYYLNKSNNYLNSKIRQPDKNK